MWRVGHLRHVPKKSEFNIFLIHTRYSIYSPKESALALSIVGPLGLSGSLFLGLLGLDFYHPTNRDLYLVGGWVGVAYFWVKIVFFKVILELFSNCLGIVFELKRPTLGVFINLNFVK